MSISVTLPDQLAARLAQEAERRNTTPDEFAVEVLIEHIPAQREASAEARATMAAFIGDGASNDGYGAADSEEYMKTHGFGR